MVLLSGLNIRVSKKEAFMFKRLLTLVVFSAFVLSASMAEAIKDRVELKGRIWDRGDKGEAIINDAILGQKEVVVKVNGLEPNSVYTVWLVNEKPQMNMTGLGGGDYSFKTDSQGNGEFRATVPEEDLANWEKLEVAYHPDGNPENMDNMKVALKGDLQEEEKD